jgi:hypothetical protein
MGIQDSIALTIGVKDRAIEVLRKTDAVEPVALKFCVYIVSIVYQNISDRDHITPSMLLVSFTPAELC